MLFEREVQSSMKAPRVAPNESFTLFNFPLHLEETQATMLAQEGNLPALIHWTAGKDRTGYVAALIQLYAGVPYETVLQHYLLTNHYYRHVWKRKQRL